MNAIETLRDLYAGQGMLALIDLPFVVIFLILIGLVGGWLVLVPVIVIGVVGLAAVFIGARLRASCFAGTSGCCDHLPKPYMM